MNIGEIGENAACDYLKQHKYKILARNYRKPYGEIDIIVQKEETVSFVEVKTRKNAVFGLPCEAVTRNKQEKLIQTAYAYLEENESDFLVETNYSFDIIEIFHKAGKVVSVHHIPNAFGLE